MFTIFALLKKINRVLLSLCCLLAAMQTEMIVHTYCPESLHSCSNVVKTNEEWHVSCGADPVLLLV